MLSDWTYSDVENYFNFKANCYKDELDRITYAELIAKIGENIIYIDKDLMVKMFNAIYAENDLDKLAGYYKFIEGWANNEPYIDSELWNEFLIEKNIFPIDDLIDQINNDLKTNGINANIYLANDLLKLKEIELPKTGYVQIDEDGRAKRYDYTDIKFENWLSSQDLEKCTVPYDKEDFINEFDLREQYKDELEEKEEKRKSFSYVRSKNE
ncbi:hypothetical protein MBOVa_3770 [Mycoplasmopsis bovis 8790]|nr:hypothetical protein MBOVa_3770 [Mycoplasmopsis bovis 8790]